MKKIIEWIYLTVDWVSILSLMTMVILVFLNVLLRYAFNSGLPWSEEAARIAFVWVVFLGVIIANRDGSHLKVDILTSHFKGLAKRLFVIFEKTVTVVILLSVIIGGSKLIALTHIQDLPATGLPTSIIYIAGVLSFAILLITIIASIVNKIKVK